MYHWTTDGRFRRRRSGAGRWCCTRCPGFAAWKHCCVRRAETVDPTNPCATFGARRKMSSPSAPQPHRPLPTMAAGNQPLTACLSGYLPSCSSARARQLRLLPGRSIASRDGRWRNWPPSPTSRRNRSRPGGTSACAKATVARDNFRLLPDTGRWLARSEWAHETSRRQALA